MAALAAFFASPVLADDDDAAPVYADTLNQRRSEVRKHLEKLKECEETTNGSNDAILSACGNLLDEYVNAAHKKRVEYDNRWKRFHKDCPTDTTTWRPDCHERLEELAEERKDYPAHNPNDDPPQHHLSCTRYGPFTDCTGD